MHIKDKSVNDREKNKKASGSFLELAYKSLQTIVLQIMWTYFQVLKSIIGML